MFNFKEIQKRAYYIHLKFPNNSEETNWHIATKQIEELQLNKYNNEEYIVDFMKPNFYTTKTLDINHYSDYKMNQFDLGKKFSYFFFENKNHTIGLYIQ